MSIAVMVTEGPKIQKEVFSGKENMPSAGGKKSRKEMAKEAMAKRAGLAEKKPQPQAKRPSEIAPESEQAETLIGMLRIAASEDEMREILESFQDYVKPQTVSKAFAELPEDKRDSLLKALEDVATVEDLEKYKSFAAHLEKPSVSETPTAKPQEAAQVPEAPAVESEAPIAEPIESSVVSIETAVAPETATPVIEPSAEIKPLTETSAGTDYYEFLKSYVEGRAQRRQVETEEQNLQGKLRRRPKKHPAKRAQEEREESRISTAPEFPSTEEMDKVSAEINDAMGRADVAWRLLIAYKQLNARTLQKIEELRRLFLGLERLRNRFEEAKARGRALVEQKETELKKSHGSVLTGLVKRSPSFGMSIGEELKSKGVPIFRGKNVLTPKELHAFLKERKMLEKQNKLERQQKKRSQKDALRLRSRIKEVASEYLEKAEEAFGRGMIKQKEFTAKRDFAKRLSTGGDIAQILDVGFGEGILSQAKYQELKSALVEGPVVAEKKETLEELNESFGSGEITLKEFLRRKQQLT